jgi:hypothetical protein
MESLELQIFGIQKELHQVHFLLDLLQKDNAEMKKQIKALQKQIEEKETEVID